MRNWRVIYLSVALTTLASLLLELSLTRIFSVVFYYHFAFLAISIALFGLGAGGAFTYAARLRADFGKLSLMTSAASASVLLALAWLLTRRQPGAWDLALVYFLSALPFFFAGMTVSLAISETIERVNRVYFFDLAGAAAGCVLLIPLLDLSGGPNTVLATAVLFALAARLWSALSPRRFARRLSLALLVVTLAAFFLNWRWKLLDVRHAKGRDLARQNERFVKWNSFSRVALAGEPGSGMIYIDADASTGIPLFDFDRLSEADRREALKLGPSLPFLLRPGAKALILGAGGGWDVARALASGSRDVTAVEINPLIADTIMRRRFPHYSAGLYWRPEVRLVIEDARTFVRRSRERYQVIQATLVDTWAATAAGAYALSENNLYTVEAFREYLEHLTEDGVLAFTRWGLQPPRESLRMVSLAAAVLERMGEPEPWRHVVVFREGAEQELAGWGVLDHILISRRPLTPEDSRRLRESARERGLWPACLPDETIPGPFTELLRSPDRRAFLREYPFDVSPVTDNRPFFFYTVQPRDILNFLSRIGRASADYQINRAVPMLFTLLGVSLLATALLVALPPLVGRGGLPRGAGIESFLSYFVFIGVGYILIQVALVQRFVLLLGRPASALSVIIFSMLVASGLGSYFSRSLAGERAERLGIVLLVIALAVSGLAVSAGPLGAVAVAWPMPAKILLAVLAVSPRCVPDGCGFSHRSHAARAHTCARGALGLGVERGGQRAGQRDGSCACAVPGAARDLADRRADVPGGLGHDATLGAGGAGPRAHTQPHRGRRLREGSQGLAFRRAVCAVSRERWWRKSLPGLGLRQACRPGSEAQRTILAFVPERNLFAPGKFDTVDYPRAAIATSFPEQVCGDGAEGVKDARPAGAGIDVDDARGPGVGVGALRPPVLEEFLEAVVPAGSGFRAAPHAVGVLIIASLQCLEELLNLAASRVCAQGQMKAASHRHGDHQRQHDPANETFPPFLLDSVPAQEIRHGRLPASRLIWPETFCRTRRWPPASNPELP